MDVLKALVTLADGQDVSNLSRVVELDTVDRGSDADTVGMGLMTYGSGNVHPLDQATTLKDAHRIGIVGAYHFSLDCF